MKTTVTFQQDLSPKQLAEALSNATPDEFAKFWLEFANITDDKKLNLFAEAMVPNQGANRKIVFNKLHQLIQYHEIKSKHETNSVL